MPQTDIYTDLLINVAFTGYKNESFPGIMMGRSCEIKPAVLNKLLSLKEENHLFIFSTMLIFTLAVAVY